LGMSSQWHFYRNPHVLPRFQLYASARTFPTPDAVLAKWSDRQRDELFIEANNFVPALNTPADALAASSWQVASATPSRSVLTVKAAAPLWLFMADSDYPGWHVYIDGELAPHYSAQILGKAAAIPAGEHRVEFIFKPWSFRIGLFISMLAIFVVAGLLICNWRTCRMPKSAG